MPPGWRPTASAIGAFGPTLTLPYDDRAARRPAPHPGPRADPGSGRPAPEERGGAADANTMCARWRRSGGEADLIGFHGQTILHQPDRRRTWQVGDAAELAWRTGVPVAYDFRSADVAAGGQGAPLAPVYHAALARDVPKPLAVLNIGGVANVTWIGAGRRTGRVRHRSRQRSAGRLDRAPDRQPHSTATARSRGPGRSMRRCCTGCWPIPISSRPPPKSLDRLDFAASLAASGLDDLSPADGAATLVAFTAAAAAPRAAAGDTAALAGHRRRPAQSGDHGGAARLGWARRSIRSRRWAGTAMRWRRSASASSPRAPAPGCRSAFPARPAFRGR